MSDGVYTAMNAVQAVGDDTGPPGPFMDTGLLQLRDRHHTVLVGRNPGYEGIRIAVVTFPSHGGR